MGTIRTFCRCRTAEPEYGPDAIQPITKRIFDTNNGKIYRATEPKDFEWLSPNYTNVETQTFYFTDLSNGNIDLHKLFIRMSWG